MMPRGRGHWLRRGGSAHKNTLPGRAFWHPSRVLFDFARYRRSSLRFRLSQGYGGRADLRLLSGNPSGCLRPETARQVCESNPETACKVPAHSKRSAPFARRGIALLRDWRPTRRAPCADVVNARPTGSRSVGRLALPGSEIWGLVVSVFLALSAGAQTTNAPTNHVDLTELPLEALMNLDVPKVYAASKVEQKETEAPSSITIVSSDEVKKYGYRTLADILQSVPGFYVTYDRDYDYLGIRGLELGDYNNRVLLLVDGHRVNDNLTDNAAIGTDFILDVDLI